MSLGTRISSCVPSSGSSSTAGLQPRDELVEPQLLEPLPDRLELARAELDQPAALLAELERLAQPGLPGVQLGDDRLDALAGGLVGEGDVGRSHAPQGTGGSGRTPRRPSWKRSASAGRVRA